MMAETPPPWHHTLLVILKELCWPVFLAAPPVLLPWPLAFPYWLAIPCAEWLQQRRQGHVSRQVSQWGVMSCLGLGLAVWLHMPGLLAGFLCGAATVVVALMLLDAFEACAGLIIQRSDLAVTVPYPANSAWGSEPPTLPDGTALRVIDHGEIAMGGPVIYDYLFPDGCVIRGGGGSCGVSPDGRYFATPAPSRNAWSLLLFDRKERLLYICAEVDMIWEIDAVSDEAVIGRNSPLTDDTAHSIAIAALKQQSRVETIVPVEDISILSLRA